MSAMTKRSQAVPPVADGETPFTPWQDIDVRSTLYRQYRVWLTPDAARAWLKHNVLNRNVNPTRLRSLRRALRRGDILLGPDSVGFCSATGLISGAHRMTACAEEGLPIEISVVTGLQERVRWTVDTPQLRTLPQNLKMMGYQNPIVLGSLARAVWRFEELGEIRKSGGPREYAQLPELDELIRKYPQVQRYAQVANEVYWKIDRKETPTVLGLSLWMMARGSEDPGVAIEFMRQLAYAPPSKPLALATEEDEPVTPAALLRRRILSPGYSKAGKTDLTRVTAVIEAWNAWVTGDHDWVPPHLEQAASVPVPLYPGNEYPALLREAMPDARTWQPASAA